MHLLVVGRLKLEELGGVVDKREDDNADDVSTPLAHVSLHSNNCQEIDSKMQNIKVHKYFIQRRIKSYVMNTDSLHNFPLIKKN